MPLAALRAILSDSVLLKQTPEPIKNGAACLAPESQCCSAFRFHNTSEGFVSERVFPSLSCLLGELPRCTWDSKVGGEHSSGNSQFQVSESSKGRKTFQPNMNFGSLTNAAIQI